MALTVALRTLFLGPPIRYAALAFTGRAAVSCMRVDSGAFTKCTLSDGGLDVNFTSAITDLADSKLG